MTEELNEGQRNCLNRIMAATHSLFDQIGEDAFSLETDEEMIAGAFWKRKRQALTFFTGAAVGALGVFTVLNLCAPAVPVPADEVTAQLMDSDLSDSQSLMPVAEINLPIPDPVADSAPAAEEPEETAAVEPQSAGSEETAAVEGSPAGESKETAAAEPPKPEEIEKYAIKPRESLANVLKRASLPAGDIGKITTAMQSVLNLRQIQVGDLVEVAYASTEENGRMLMSVTVEDRRGNRYTAARTDIDVFEAERVEPVVSYRTERADGTISGAFVKSARNAGVPSSVVQQIVWAFDGPVDFSRDLYKGDSFSAVFKKEYNKDGEPTGNGELLYAELNLHSKIFERYRYKDSMGREDFYDEKGKIARKLFIMHPLKKPRLTSKFGMRKHPILKYATMHWGVDYGAPVGTPIHAPGEGVVTQAGRRGSYGRYVQIRHNSEFTSAYGHMSRIADNIYAGKRVKAGDIIGYVGNTGRSTGPHLHWELTKNGKRISPTTQKITAQRKLTGSELARFYSARNQMRDELQNEGAFARAEARPEARKVAYREKDEPKKVQKQKPRAKTQTTASRRTDSSKG